MSDFRVNSITNQDGSAGPQVCGVSTFSGKSGVQIPSGSSEFRRQDGGGRSMGLIAGAQSGNATMNKVEIPTTGDATDFGDATIANEHRAGISNSIRGVNAGSGSPAIGNTIDFITIATTGDAVDFGDTTTNMGYTAGCSDSHGGLE